MTQTISLHSVPIVDNHGHAGVYELRDGSIRTIREKAAQLGYRKNMLAEALRTAVRSCRFVPGADENGRHIRLWVVMQVRFAP